MTEPDTAHQLPNRTTPTWEVELLISGVAVFAMLQLPGWLDDQVFALEPRITEAWRLVLVIGYIYSKSAAIVLAITFAMHLLLRAQWIALVGMHSVYPQGVRLDRLRMGPIQRKLEAERFVTTEDAIERADNRASVVFAIGVTIASIIAVVCLVFCGALVVVTLLALALGLGIDPFKLMAGVFAVAMVPFGIAAALDQAIGARTHGSAAAKRAIAAVLRFYTRIGLGRRNNHVMAILSSNDGERKMLAIVVGVMVAAFLAVSTTFFAMRTDQRFGSYAYFPDSDALASEAASYDDQRDPTRDPAVPYIQSSVVVGPYVKLVVPYRPRLDEPAMRKRCADMPALKDDALARARLACLQSIRRLTLDGSPIKGLRYEIASDPRTERPALLAMIDVRDLPKGRHELRIARPLRAGARRDEHKSDPGYDRIPFWR